MQEPLSLYKADIDSAFRRIPIAPEQRDFALVAFKAQGSIHVMRHKAMPFGAIASVVNWDRIGFTFCLSICRIFLRGRVHYSGSLICCIARRILHLPMLRYVDDFFSVERKSTTEEAKLVFARYLIL